jgi:hypothetical protein
MFRRIAVAAVALLVGIAVSAGLVAYSSAAGAARSYLALARDLPAGATLTSDSLLAVRAGLEQAQAAGVFAETERGRVLGGRVRHQLSGGQLLQRADLEPAGAEAADSLVAVPLKEMPPLHAGDRVDIFALVGSGDHFSALPFAWRVPVAAVTNDGLVLQVPSRQELAYVYAAGAMRLAAVSTTGQAAPSGTYPITSAEQAMAAAAG